MTICHRSIEPAVMTMKADDNDNIQYQNRVTVPQHVKMD